MPNQFTKPKWTKEHKDWVEEHRFDYPTFNDFIKAFNDRFNVDISKHTLIGILRKNGGNAVIHKNKKIWTKEEINWLKENYHKTINNKALCEIFNNTFNSNITINIFNHKARHMKLVKDDRKELFRLNTRRLFNKPIGSEFVHKPTGYTFIKTKEIPNDKGRHNWRDYWKIKQRYIYEKEYGEIPKGYVVIFLDGNIQNFDINNLEICTNKELLHLQTLGWAGKGELTRAGLEVIRSEQSLVDVGAIKRQKSDINRLKKYRKNKKELEQ